MKELTLGASTENVVKVIEFVDDELIKYGCSKSEINRINVAIDEVYSNIANYAYHPMKGNVTIKIDIQENPLEVVIYFIDDGAPYNPLEKEDPDITLSSEERPIGGLGVFIVKKIMDEFMYEYRDNHNVQKIKKLIN